MEPLVKTFYRLSKPTADFFNDFQDMAMSWVPGSLNNDLSAMGTGVDVRTYQSDYTGIAPATMATLDSSIDWRDRFIWGQSHILNGTEGTQGQLPGQSADTKFDSGDPGGIGIKAVAFAMYTGTGAVSNVATGAAVSNGNPPFPGVGAFRSYMSKVIWYTSDHAYTSNLSIFCDTSGVLKVYNHGAVYLHPVIFVCATGKTGKR